jgi:tetratricopeptide (TPR) repeat protein
VPSSDRIDELKKRYDENPRRFFASLANEYRKAGDLEQAISLCQSHLAEQPGNMNGHVVYGQALFEAGRYDEAKETFEAALTLDPENLIALRHLGDIACTNGANDKAREWYTRVLDADPRNDEIIALLASLDEQAKKDAIGAPIASLESMAPREARGEPFKPPQVITPLSTASVADRTPIAPIESIDTQQIPAVAAPAEPAPRPTLGLMDLTIDFDSTPAESPLTLLPPADDDPGAGTDFLQFEEVSLGVPLEPLPRASAEVEALSDLSADPFGDPGPLDIQSWDPPVVEAAPVDSAAPEAAAPVEAVAPAASAPASAPADDGLDMLFGDSLPAEPAAPFVTETMAELYLQQGFTAEALDVYRQLSAASPDDERLKDRVRRLERGERTSVSLDIVPDEAPLAADGAVPLGGMLDFDQTPVAAHEVVPEPAPDAAAAQEMAAQAMAVQETARGYFAALAARRAVKSDARARTAPRASTPRASSPRISAQAQPVAAPMASAASVTSLDELFSGGPVAAYDESVALAFAQVAGAAEMGGTAVKGKPTAPAATELSLDSVFRGSDSRTVTPAGTISRQSQTLRFDQFFATGGDEAETPAPAEPTHSAPVGEPGSPAEIKQFQSWLTGLKKP